MGSPAGAKMLFSAGAGCHSPRSRVAAEPARWAAVALAAALALPVGGAAQASVATSLKGHLSVGYAKLFIPDAPGGSFSVAGGIDAPLARDLRAGIGLGYHLLGSRTVERGSLLANLDYSMFETVLYASWYPEHWGPIGIISVGPALMSSHVELSAAGGGAAFSDLAVSEVDPGVALDLTLIRQGNAPVRVGLELSGRVAFVEPQTWTLGAVRLAVHY